MHVASIHLLSSRVRAKRGRTGRPSLFFLSVLPPSKKKEKEKGNKALKAKKKARAIRRHYSDPMGRKERRKRLAGADKPFETSSTPERGEKENSINT